MAAPGITINKPTRAMPIGLLRTLPPLVLAVTLEHWMFSGSLHSISGVVNGDFEIQQGMVENRAAITELLS